MNIYVETNYVLELTFRQEESNSCEEILSLGKNKDNTLLIPAFSLAEPLEKLHRQKNTRREIQANLDKEIQQLSGTTGYKTRLKSIKKVDSLFTQSIDDERKRFENYKNKILQVARVISLDSTIISEAATFEKKYDLSGQDAIVYASVLSHLRSNQKGVSCFLNRNSKDFNDPNIISELKSLNCTMIPRFDDGLRFIKKRG